MNDAPKKFREALHLLLVQVPDGQDSQDAAHTILLNTIEKLMDVTAQSLGPVARKNLSLQVVDNALGSLQDLIDTEQSPCVD